VYVEVVGGGIVIVLVVVVVADFAAPVLTTCHLPPKLTTP
jgi:hypothetical protein